MLINESREEDKTVKHSTLDMPVLCEFVEAEERKGGRGRKYDAGLQAGQEILGKERGGNAPPISRLMLWEVPYCTVPKGAPKTKAMRSSSTAELPFRDRWIK